MSFVKEISINHRKKITPEQKIEAEDKRLEALSKDSQMVTGIFKNLESPGGDLEFTYKKYKEEPFKVYHLYDGQEYTIPLGVAKHLNNGTAYAQRDYATGPDGTKQLYTIIKSRKQRYQFLSREFM